jgi:hypothetical protein
VTLEPGQVRVKIENAYSDGHESTRQVDLPAPAGDLTDWFELVVHPETGDGHGLDRELGSVYIATIIEAEDASLIGEVCEWMD